MSLREKAEKLAWGVSGLKGSIDGDADMIEKALLEARQEALREAIEVVKKWGADCHYGCDCTIIPEIEALMEDK